MCFVHNNPGTGAQRSYAKAAIEQALCRIRGQVEFYLLFEIIYGARQNRYFRHHWRVPARLTSQSVSFECAQCRKVYVKMYNGLKERKYLFSIITKTKFKPRSRRKCCTGLPQGHMPTRGKHPQEMHFLKTAN